MPVERLIIAGFGSIGQRHLRIARALLPQADIRVLRHQPSKSCPELADGCLSSLKDALAYAPQAAVIANPSTFHLQTALELARAGVHLLVEKPLAASSEGVAPFLNACAEHRNVLMVGYNLRFMPSLQHFRKLILAGQIGEVLSVRCEVGQYLPSWRPEIDYRKTVSATRALGGGVLLELSHELDYLRWIFGEFAWVKATLSRQSNLEIDVEDTAHLVLGFRTLANGHALIAGVNMDFVRHDTTRQCLAIGDRGSLRWNGLTGTVDCFPIGCDQWQQLFSHMPERDESYTSEWQHFLSCIQTGTTPEISGNDGLAVLSLIDAARASSATGFTEMPAHLSL